MSLNILIYCRHNEEMIERLENAGLGFFVKPTETQQKLGKVLVHHFICDEYLLHCLGEIPLRQLVYRVLDLPPSLRPMVYDFGQLNTNTESDYIRQIVQDYVSLLESCFVPVPVLATLTNDERVLRWWYTPE
jgi:hypothetical protein